ncbi:MAG: prepilin-type N-terminal cleavage/methylation domain-containing protein [Kiritimatiellae bacterium]|nr:prepilin-type N-terminal cleavage/methylation domain-containing protein [Kiritimatiellia bacterium]
MKRSGFTVLELLVASLLLSMLVTMLTMIFNQSSIAWRTGVAGVVELDRVRARLGTYHDIEDDALPGLGQTASQMGSGASDSRDVLYRTVSVFKGWNGSGKLQQSADRDDSNCRGRLYDQLKWYEASGIQFSIQDARVGRANTGVGAGTVRGGKAFVVGVRSRGPDKVWDTADDINTFPEDVD